MRKRQIVLTPFGNRQREISLGIRDHTNAIRLLFEADTDVFHIFTAFVDDMTFYNSLSPPRHCYEDKQNG